MGTKKDIGKLFKERLGDFEQSPDAGLWDSIASELDKSQSRRITPLWYYIGGSVLLGVLVIIWFTVPAIVSNSELDSQVVTNQINVSKNDSINTILNLDVKNFVKVSVNQEGTSKEDASIAKNRNTGDDVVTAYDNKNLNSKKNAGLKSAETTKRDNYLTDKRTNNSTLTKSAVVDKVLQDDIKSQNKTLISTLEDFKNVIASKTKIHNSKEKTATAAYIAKKQFELDKIIALQKEEATLLMQERVKRKTDSLVQVREIQLAQIKEQSTKKELSKTIENREQDRKEAIEYEIAISPYTSVLSYGSLTKGSSLDNRLINNPREGISTVGYGIRVDYTLNERASLRLGVGFTPLKYQTDNFQVSVNEGDINIYELSAITINSTNSQNSTESTPEALSFFNSNSIVSLQQNISYVEVPVDYQYRFINKRISLSINPGVSLFILNNNEIFATADSGESIFIGRETNLSGLSLAFNLGLGGHYNINNKWRLNVEPVFRYQLNPYMNNQSNFRPFYVGAQFGMSYKF